MDFYKTFCSDLKIIISDEDCKSLLDTLPIKKQIVLYKRGLSIFF